MNIVFLLIGLAVGFALAFLFLKSKSESALGTSNEKSRMLEQNVNDLKAELRSVSNEAERKLTDERKRAEELSDVSKSVDRPRYPGASNGGHHATPATSSMEPTESRRAISPASAIVATPSAYGTKLLAWQVLPTCGGTGTCDWGGAVAHGGFEKSK